MFWLGEHHHCRRTCLIPETAIRQNVSFLGFALLENHAFGNRGYLRFHTGTTLLSIP